MIVQWSPIARYEFSFNLCSMTYDNALMWMIWYDDDNDDLSDDDNDMDDDDMIWWMIW